jgi:hypothetical protein
LGGARLAGGGHARRGRAAAAGRLLVARAPVQADIVD